MLGGDQIPQKSRIGISTLFLASVTRFVVLSSISLQSFSPVSDSKQQREPAKLTASGIIGDDSHVEKSGQASTQRKTRKEKAVYSWGELLADTSELRHLV